MPAMSQICVSRDVSTNDAGRFPGFPHNAVKQSWYNSCCHETMEQAPIDAEKSRWDTYPPMRRASARSGAQHRRKRCHPAFAVHIRHPVAEQESAFCGENNVWTEPSSRCTYACNGGYQKWLTELTLVVSNEICSCLLVSSPSSLLVSH